MGTLMETWRERFPDWTQALLEHMQVSLLSLMLAVAIAVPLGILLRRHDKASEAALHVTGIVQTVPSLALLGLLIPIIGIGATPAVIALVAYALFPILQATITGLKGIDPTLEEAGDAFGMTDWQKLRIFELPLAMPVIVAGIRTSAVMIIGTATLAALIGAGGLGSFILLGIDRNDNALILIGAISAAVLAMAFNAAIRWMERLPLRRLCAAAVAVVMALGVSYVPAVIADRTDRSESIVIAGKLGPEPEILMNMYKLLIEENTDLKVTVKPNFGKTSFLYEALKRGDIDIYPEFTGTIVESLLKTRPATSTDPGTVYEQARKGIRSQDDLVLLKPMLFEDTYAVAVRKDYAEEHDLAGIEDLSKVQDTALAGFSLEFNDREDGNRGLRRVYQLDLKVRTMEPSLRYEALTNGDVQIVDAYSTDAEISQYHLVALKDTKHMFPPYQGAPLMKASLLTRHPELERVLNKLAGRISDDEMSTMNYEVKVRARAASQVAKEYLAGHGLLKS
jgi:osmoprotectant transport system permease protein